MSDEWKSASLRAFVNLYWCDFKHSLLQHFTVFTLLIPCSAFIVKGYPVYTLHFPCGQVSVTFFLFSCPWSSHLLFNLIVILIGVDYMVKVKKKTYTKSGLYLCVFCSIKVVVLFIYRVLCKALTSTTLTSFYSRWRKPWWCWKMTPLWRRPPPRAPRETSQPGTSQSRTLISTMTT